MNKDFVCLRCGQCCKKLVKRDFWKSADPILPMPAPGQTATSKLSKMQQCFLENNRILYPEKDEGCEMLILENGVYTCLVWKAFGPEFLPAACRDYPQGNTHCLGENK